MTKKKTKKEARVVNDSKENPVDFIAEKDGGDAWQAKTIEAHSETTFQDDLGEGETVTIRFFDYQANPETFRKQQPTAQDLFNSHLKQIELELWKDGWSIDDRVLPRLIMATDKTHYRIAVTAKVARGSSLSYVEQPKKLSQLNGITTENS